jgi:hypothetical protein
VRTATITALLRNTKEVVAQTDAGPVRITRRDGVDLVLVRVDDLDAEQAGSALCVGIAREAFAHNRDMTAALRALYPWTGLFSPHAMTQFAAEMDKLVWSAISLGRFRAALVSFAGWKATAEALADGLGGRDTVPQRLLPERAPADDLTAPRPR